MGKMNKPFYVDYVRHCLRFYTRTTFKPQFKSEVDENNWYACHRAMEHFSDEDKNIILKVYGMRDTIEDNVFQMATLYWRDQNDIWLMLERLERLVARKRGLI